ncbi:LTA synthase family protein [Bifidobacterium tsurumiense]|uniref:LTA synthase family protein n=1 Tax=Bifidobacterium tsurumiense TaxID=356829 RepID=UPI001E5710B3|nr:LTA synthase family protein [Bifidobacterium tsurumiense]
MTENAKMPDTGNEMSVRDEELNPTTSHAQDQDAFLNGPNGQDGEQGGARVATSDDVAQRADASDDAEETPKRKGFPLWLYALLFVIFDAAMVMVLQWGVTQSSTRVELSSPLLGVWGIVSKMWGEQNYVFLLNLLLLGAIYAVVILLFNRFWLATPVLMAIAIVIAVIERFKIQIRYEAILPSDLNFLGSNTGEILSFSPTGAFWVISGSIVSFTAFAVLCIVLSHMDGRHGRIFRFRNAGLSISLRLILLAIPCLFLTLYVNQVATVDSWANTFSKRMGDIPSMWDSVYDAQRNGPLVSFLRQLNPKVMEEPDGYSQETMDEIAARYASDADSINAERNAYLNDNTVVFVLSESFSDPARVPGLQVNKDAMPNIREIKSETTSGLMLSSGYGGGTANLEYMGLTGLSMANFDASLTSPYQQLVPSEHWTPTINQMWGAPSNSIAFHPYEPSMYSRATNYKKFGFSHFYTLQAPDVIAYQDKIDNSPYVSDESTYESALETISSNDDNQFIQIITMQNHMPYNSWYANNDFTAHSVDPAAPLDDGERVSIETYAKGVSLTDDATQAFLDELDSLDKPVTVVFYGDHLPGIYSSAGANADNSLALHLTDYFIWSNTASASRGTKNDDSAYSSPNFFVAQTAEHMNAKVSPYLAFLTELHEKIAALEPPVVNNIQGWDRIPEGQSVYLDNEGRPMSEEDFDEETEDLMRDYRLIQYDITAGKNYLKDTGFMTTPSR